MSSKKPIVINSEVNKVAGLKSFVGKKQEKSVDFMGEKIPVRKLTVAQVMEIQEKAKDAGEDESRNFDLLKDVIRYGAEGGDDLSDEDFDSFALDDLTKLSSAIMKHSGISPEQGKGKAN